MRGLLKGVAAGAVEEAGRGAEVLARRAALVLAALISFAVALAFLAAVTRVSLAERIGALWADVSLASTFAALGLLLLALAVARGRRRRRDIVEMLAADLGARPEDRPVGITTVVAAFAEGLARGLMHPRDHS
jgi:hypothetical protein